jgi:hypothetical protein
MPCIHLASVERRGVPTVQAETCYASCQRAHCCHDLVDVHNHHPRFHTVLTSWCRGRTIHSIQSVRARQGVDARQLGAGHRDDNAGLQAASCTVPTLVVDVLPVGKAA